MITAQQAADIFQKISDATTDDVNATVCCAASWVAGEVQAQSFIHAQEIIDRRFAQMPTSHAIFTAILSQVEQPPETLLGEGEQDA
jgi:hypothetical protein